MIAITNTPIITSTSEKAQLPAAAFGLSKTILILLLNTVFQT